MTSRLAALLFAAALLARAPPASAEEEEAPRRLRDPQGSVLLGLTGGLALSSDFTYGSVGAQAGYAIFDGVVPGLRGNIFFGDVGGGEAAATLWLTPPIDFVVVPFVAGELGYAARELDDDTAFDGAMYGLGGGVHLGRADEPFALRAGVIYRYYDFGAGDGTISPLVVASLRL
jgi:hypothetical protein